MENLRIYTINFIALIASGFEMVVPPLQALSLLLAIIYTLIQIIQKIKNKQI